MKQTESDILNIDLVCYSLKELRCCLGSVKLGNNLRIACSREITPLGFLAFLNIMNHLKPFLHMVYLKMENGNHLSFKYTSRDF